MFYANNVLYVCEVNSSLCCLQVSRAILTVESGNKQKGRMLTETHRVFG